MKLNIGLLLAITGLPLILFAETDDARITKLENEVKKLQEANAEMLKNISERPVPIIRRRVAPSQNTQQPGEQNTSSKQDAEKINKIEGELFYGYEDDGSFVYAMFLRKTDKDNEYEVTWTLPFYDQKYRNGEIFILSKNSDGKVQFKRGRPEYHLYDAEIDTKGNLVNGSRFVLDKSKTDKTKWNLFKVK